VSASYDVVIAGLGAMGSAAAYHLARRGRRVLGLDRFAPPHTLGSSHGQTRIIREAYFEHPCYVPLVRRAYELWAELAAASGRRLLHITGGLMLGTPDSAVVRGALRSAREHRLPHELLSAREVRQRFPALQPQEGMTAVFEPRAGVLFAEDCVSAHLEGARRAGADLRFNAPVTHWAAEGKGAVVRTAKESFRAGALLLTAGSWLPDLLPEWQLPLAVERQMLFWFDPARAQEHFLPERCPVHLWEFDAGRFFYGMPDFGNGVKIARHHEGEIVSPGAVRREVSPAEAEDVRGTVRRFLPDANGPLRASAVCLYTNTPDGNFWIDWHPEHRRVLIASPCSGHGFKFSAAMGEALADLLCEGRCRFDLELFRTRF
jgi:sarcosine oxidase